MTVENYDSTFFDSQFFKVSELLISIANFGPKFYLIKSCLILLEISHIFTRYLIQKMSKFELNCTIFY